MPTAVSTYCALKSSRGDRGRHHAQIGPVSPRHRPHEAFIASLGEAEPLHRRKLFGVVSCLQASATTDRRTRSSHAPTGVFWVAPAVLRPSVHRKEFGSIDTHSVKDDSHLSGQRDLRTLPSLPVRNTHRPSLHRRPSGSWRCSFEQGRAPFSISDFVIPCDPSTRSISPDWYRRASTRDRRPRIGNAGIA